MKAPFLAATALTLALTACGHTAAPDADSYDESQALTLASQTVRLSPAQARALGLAAPADPVTATLAVKVGKAGTKYAGQKRAYLSWKLDGSAANLSGATTGTYALSLTDGAGASLKDKAGTVSATLSGSQKTSRSRSTAYVETSLGACATATFSLTTPSGSVTNGAAPLQVCEAGTAAPAPAPAPAPTLASVSLRSWFGDAKGVMNAFVGLSNVPSGATVASSYTFADAEECGAGDRYGTYGTGEWTKTTTADAGQPVYRVPVDVQGASLRYSFTVSLSGVSRVFDGVLCYKTSGAGPNAD